MADRSWGPWARTWEPCVQSELHSPPEALPAQPQAAAHSHHRALATTHVHVHLDLHSLAKPCFLPPGMGGGQGLSCWTHLVRGARGNIGQATQHQPPHTGTRVLLSSCQVVQQGLQKHQVIDHIAAEQLGAEAQ